MEPPMNVQINPSPCCANESKKSYIVTEDNTRFATNRLLAIVTRFSCFWTVLILCYIEKSTFITN